MKVNIKPPFRVVVSSFNGVFNEEYYSNNIEIEKFTIFNTDFFKRQQYTVQNENSEIPLDKIVNESAKDILAINPNRTIVNNNDKNNNSALKPFIFSKYMKRNIFMYLVRNYSI